MTQDANRKLATRSYNPDPLSALREPTRFRASSGIAPSPSRPPRDLEVFAVNEHTVVGAMGNLMFGLTRGQCSSSVLKQRRAQHERMRTRYPSGYVYMNIIASGACMPNAETRKNITELTQEFAPHFLLHLLILEGSGVWHSSMCLIARTMALSMPTAPSANFFVGVEPALRWSDAKLRHRVQFESLAFSRELAILRSKLGW